MTEYAKEQRLKPLHESMDYFRFVKYKDDWMRCVVNEKMNLPEYLNCICGECQECDDSDYIVFTKALWSFSQLHRKELSYVRDLEFKKYLALHGEALTASEFVWWYDDPHSKEDKYVDFLLSL